MAGSDILNALEELDWEKDSSNNCESATLTSLLESKVRLGAARHERYAVIKAWSAAKDTRSQIITTQDTPVCPPSPNLSHLTPEEICAIHNVINRQVEFERQEANRIKKLREELESIQQQLGQRLGVSARDKKSVDVRLCQVCFKTKFDDGMGRICEDCQKRVCQKCGAYSGSSWSTNKVQSERKWHCKLCTVRREVLCRTGGWYRGPPANSAEELRKKLWMASSLDETQSRDNIKEQNRHYQSGNRTDTELVRTMTGYQKSRRPSLSKQPRRYSLLIDSGSISKKGDKKTEDEDDDKESLKMFILDRQMSRRKRQEKRQRPRRKSVSTGLKKSPSCDDSKGDSADCSDTDSSSFSSFSNSIKSNEGLVISSAASTSLGAIHTDALSLNKSCVGIPTPTNVSKLQTADNVHEGSVQFQRETSRESLEIRSTIDHFVKTLQTESQGMHISKDSLGKSMQKWRQSGFPNVCPVLLHWLPKGCPFGVKVTGGVQGNTETTKALVTWVSSQVKANVNVGNEVLEWNGEPLGGQTYDSVISVTSHISPQALLLVDLSVRREGRHLATDGHEVNIEDHPSNQTAELHGKRAKFRTLPRTPIEIKHGEILLKVHYQATRSELSVTVLKARHVVAADYNDTRTFGVFVAVSLVPGKSTRTKLETDLQSYSRPQWNQTFVLGGVSLTELVSRALQLSVWSRKGNCDLFLGEVLLDLAQAPLDGQPRWYILEDHDENSSPLPEHRSQWSPIKSNSVTSQYFKDSNTMCPSMLHEVLSRRNSPSSTGGSSSVSPVPFGTSQTGSKEFYFHSVSQPDSFTKKVRKTMRKTVSKMSPLSLMEKKDTAGSDDSISSEKIRRLSNKSDKSVSNSKRQNLQKPTQNLNPNLDLLAPPQALSRTSSCSSLFMSDDEDIPGQWSMLLLTQDRPPPESEGNKSALGPGQIPAKSSTETTVCGDVKLGFMVSKGQLDVDIICASGLHWDGQLPDTYAKTCLMEGKKAIQSKKTTVVKATSDPVYCKRIKYSASNIHGRIMKIAIWRRGSNFDKKACLGELLVRLDMLDLSKPIVAWYKLFHMNSTEYGSEEWGSDEHLSFW